jgi:hypothetical protein
MDSVTRLFTCTFPAFWDKDGMEFTLGFLDELAGSIPSYELSFLPDKGAIQYLKNIT